jgi:hypothetical protein
MASTYFAAQYVESPDSIFNYSIKLPECILENSGELVVDLFNDGYETAACTVLTFLGNPKYPEYRKYFLEALNFDDDDQTFVCLQNSKKEFRVFSRAVADFEEATSFDSLEVPWAYTLLSLTELKKTLL